MCFHLSWELKNIISSAEEEKNKPVIGFTWSSDISRGSFWLEFLGQKMVKYTQTRMCFKQRRSAACQRGALRCSHYLSWRKELLFLGVDRNGFKLKEDVHISGASSPQSDLQQWFSGGGFILFTWHALKYKSNFFFPMRNNWPLWGNIHVTTFSPKMHLVEVEARGCSISETAWG